jgi:hypothetical protein
MLLGHNILKLSYKKYNMPAPKALRFFRDGARKKWPLRGSPGAGLKTGQVDRK